MKYEYDLTTIISVQDCELIYDAGTGIQRINLKESADIWWDLHYKNTLRTFLLGKKRKNIYAGDKCFDFSHPYIKVYAGKDEFLFQKEIPEDYETSDACEFRAWWDEINAAMNHCGYWLCDMG